MSNPSSGNVGLADAFTHAEPNEDTIRQAEGGLKERVAQLEAQLEEKIAKLEAPESGPSAGSSQRPSILKRPESRASVSSSAKALVANVVDECLIETISKVEVAPLSQSVSNTSLGNQAQSTTITPATDTVAKADSDTGNSATRQMSPSPGNESEHSQRSQERSVSQPISQASMSGIDDIDVEDIEEADEIDPSHQNLPTIREWRSTNAQFNAKIRTFTMDVNRIVNGRLSSTGNEMHQEQLDIQGAAEKIEHDRSG